MTRVSPASGAVILPNRGRGLGAAGRRARRCPGCEAKQGVELAAREGLFLGGRLNLDDAAPAGEHEVGVDLGGAVLGVVEVEDLATLVNAARDGRHLIAQRDGIDRLDLQHMLERQVQRHVAAGDRRRAGAAVGLDHVAVDLDLALAETREIGDRAQRAADQTLDFLGSARLLAARGLAVSPGRGGARQHAVFRRHPAFAGLAQPRRHGFLDRGGTQHLGIAEAYQAGALGMFADPGFQENQAQLVGGAAGRTHGLTSRGF